jgi:crotonobetainyl-CoA:carnitine CoA-transferase CaiB-like acyl-CoA transferase
VAGVFEGIRVLDLSWGTAGPMTTMFLADNGAEVTRIEPPEGDPFSAQSGYRVWNRGKRSARLDLKSADGLKFFRQMADDADVVVETFAPGVAERLGVDHDSLAVRNQRLITCTISGYGGHSGHRDRPGYDGLVAARTGLLYDQRGRRGSAMEFICGRPGPLPEFDAPEELVRGADRAGPIFPRTMWPSVGATYLATLGIAAALRARVISGEGQHVETSLLQGALASTCLNWQNVENPDAPLYWMWPADSRAIEGLFECADGRWVHHWTVRPNWVLACAEGESEPTPPDMNGPYRDDPDRLPMEPDGFVSGLVLHPMLADAFRKFTSEQWVEAGEKSGMGVALVRSPAESLADPSFLADGCVVEIEDPEVGRIRHAGPLLEFSETPGQVAGPAPVSGEHTEEVMADHRIVGPLRDPASSSFLPHPLSGVRVLDLGLGVAGPFTGRMLADLGADVIKVNAMYDGYWNGTHMGLGTNRGKRSIAVNLKHADGRAVLDRLIESADVVTTNWRPGAAARLGLDFDTLHSRFPQLVHCNTRGFEKGPRSLLPGTDQTAAALIGTEWEDGACDAGNPPLWSRSNMGDTGNALLAAIAITAALFHRDLTGRGQAVSTSIVNAGLLHTSYAWIHADGRPADLEHVDGGQYGLSPWYRLYQCADERWLFVAAVGDEHRRQLGITLDRNGLESEDAEKVAAVLSGQLLTDSSSVWFARLDGAGVPVEIVDENFCKTLFDDSEARELGLVSETISGSVGRFEDPGLLVNFSSTPGIVQRGPCMCGEHSREILLEHRYSHEEIDAMVRDKAVLDPPGS